MPVKISVRQWRSALSHWCSGLSLKTKMVGENLLVYSLACAIIYYLIRNIDIHKEIHEFLHADLVWFTIATALSFIVWFFGENLFFARLSTLLHKRTYYLEMLPVTAAVYFLRAVNILVADAALVTFLHQRKQASWSAAGATILFFGFIDGIVFSSLITIAGLAVPTSPFQGFIPYSGAGMVSLLLIAAWWMWRRPETNPERWLRERDWLVAFRKATFRIYAELIAIRVAILAPQGLFLWGCLEAFHANVPLKEAVALSPMILAASGTPLTPIGLGPIQVIAVDGFSKFAPRTEVLAAMLAFSVAQLILRLPLGLGSAGVFVRRVLRTGGREEDAQSVAQAGYSRSGALAHNGRGC